MNRKILFYCLISIFSSSLWCQSRTSDLIKISALKFDKERAAQLSKHQNELPFRLEIDGILRAKKGYQLLYKKASNQLQMLPNSMVKVGMIAPPSTEDVITLPSGDRVFCVCDYPGACYFDNSGQPYKFVCTGEECCYIGVKFNMNKPPLEYETPGGRWFGF